MELLTNVTQIPLQGPAPAEKLGVNPHASPSKPEPSKRPAYDEYTPEEPRVPTGMYYPGRDEEGNPKVYVDAIKAPDASEDAKEPGGPKPRKAADSDPEEKCTANTDKVDAEIRRLKKEKQTLEKQLRQAGDDPAKQEALQRRLDQVNEELRRKDNDTYRRQHTCFTEGTLV